MLLVRVALGERRKLSHLATEVPLPCLTISLSILTEPEDASFGDEEAEDSVASTQAGQLIQSFARPCGTAWEFDENSF